MIVKEKNAKIQISHISINDLTARLVSEDEWYKYQGVDEYTSYNGDCNKTRITK